MPDRRFIWTAVAVIAVTAISLYAANLPPAEQPAVPLGEEVSGVALPASPDPARKQEEYAYILKEYQGRIGVYSVGNDTGGEPSLVLDVLVKHLPEYDRGQLEQGIMVRDYSQLVALFEDYSS